MNWTLRFSITYRHSRLDWRGSCVVQNHFRRLFANHIYGTYNEEPRYPRENRCVYDSKPLCSMDVKAAVQYAHLLARANRATTRCMVTPGVGTDKFPQFRVCPDTFAGKHFLRNQALRFQGLGQFPNKPDSFDDRIQILLAILRAFVEIVKVYLRYISWVRRPKHDPARAVIGMCFQNRPG